MKSPEEIAHHLLEGVGMTTGHYLPHNTFAWLEDAVASAIRDARVETFEAAITILKASYDWEGALDDLRAEAEEARK
jgi:hypothetical protein